MSELTHMPGLANDTTELRDHTGQNTRRNIAGILSHLVRGGPIIAVAAVFVAVCIRLAKIVDQYSVDAFFLDHWSFEDSTLFQKHSWLEIFRWQHGPHRQGMGGLLLAIAEPMVHFDQRYVAFVMASLVACACLAALWLKHRVFGRFMYCDVVIPLLFFTPVQYETLLGANNPSHGPLPLLLVVLYCLAWTIARTDARCATVLVLNIALIYTGFGVFMGLITPVLFGLEYVRTRKWAPLISLLIAVVSMASFFIGYRNDPAVQCFSPYLQGHLNYFAFLVFLFSSFVKIYPAQSTVVPAFLAGSVLLLIVAGATASFIPKLAREGTSSPKSLAPCVMLSYSLIFCCAAAYGRTCQGLVPAPRYLIYLILAFFGLYLGALSGKIPLLRREYIGAVLLISLASSGWISANESRTMSTISRQRRTWRDCYLASHNISACDKVSESFIYSIPEPADLQPKLEFLEKRHLSLFSGH